MDNKDKKVDVYFNLHKKIFSVRHNGRVIEHTDAIQLRDVKYIVNVSGKRRVRKEKRKNVHAFVRGYICDSIIKDITEWWMGSPELEVINDSSYNRYEAKYNPYKYDSFVIGENDKPIHKSDYAYLKVMNKKPKVISFLKKTSRKDLQGADTVV